MSYRLPRKTRPQGDVEIYGGPLKQNNFNGGMNIDSPASEIRPDEIAYGSNVICRERSIESRPGTRAYYHSEQYASGDLQGILELNNSGIVAAVDARLLFKAETGITANLGSPIHKANYVAADLGEYDLGTGDAKICPYNNGCLVFTSSKISFWPGYGGVFQANAPNPVHGLPSSGSAAFKYNYLVTLSRIVTSSGTTRLDRYVSDAILLHESGTNGNRYVSAGTSTARDTDYGVFQQASAIASGSSNTISNTVLKGLFGSQGTPTDDSASPHFTHATIWRTRDYGAAGVALGNSSAIYYWVGDVERDAIFNSAATFTDGFTDDSIQNTGLILKSQQFLPMDPGACGTVCDGWIFVSNRVSSVMNYCQTAGSPELFGYHFKTLQNWKFPSAVSALEFNQDILSIFLRNSTYICNMTSFTTDVSKIQYIPVLNYIKMVDGKIGVSDWGSIDKVDLNTLIAVCSDGTVRTWDTTKWGNDLAFEKVSSEIQKIAAGSVGKFYSGAYYLWYRIDSSSSYTTKLLRYGYGGKAGSGWTYYTNFPQTPLKTGAFIAEGRGGVPRLMVLNASDRKLYWVETFTPFTGAQDVYADGNDPMVRMETDLGFYDPFYEMPGQEISCVVRFRELIGNSEADVLVHDETFNRWRPMVEADGYRSGMSVSMSAYKNGSTTAFETITEQPRTGSLKFTKEIAARRVQLGFATDTSAWRYVGIESKFRSLDKQNYATAGDNSSSESTISYPQFQAEYATDMNLWLTRREEGLDRATGVQMTPAYVGKPVLSTGPDTKSESAYHFSASATARDYTELWNSTNSYWTYDGDQDFATYPGYLATSASGSAPVFNGGALFSYPINNIAAFPLKMRHRLRCLSNNSSTTAFCIFDVVADAGFVGDFLALIVAYDNVTGNYHIEEIGTQNGVPVDNVVDTGIVRVSDVEFVIDIEVNSTGWLLHIINYGFFVAGSGYSFPTVGFIDVNVQRTNAANQGMIKDSRIYTDEGGTADARYDEDASDSYTDFTASFWVKGYSYDRDILRVDGDVPLYFQLLDSTHLDVCGYGTATLTALGSGWNYLFITRVEGFFTVYQNGVLKTFSTISANLAPMGGGDKHVGLSNGDGYIADVRLFDSEKTVAAMLYYYDNVINEQGDMVMPQV